MKASYYLITPEDLFWRPSNLMQIPNADYLEPTGSENLGARLWRLPPRSANTLHKHIRAEEFYFVLEGVGRIRVGDETLTVLKHGGGSLGQASCDRCSTIPTPRCSGSSWARRRNLNFCPAQRPSPTCRSFTRLTRSNCQRNWPVWNGRRKVERWGGAGMVAVIPPSRDRGRR